jgi:hypothetical protein
MAETEPKKGKDELLKIVRDTGTEAASLVSKGRDLVKQGQFIHDLASHTEDFITCVPCDDNLPKEAWRDQKSQWHALHAGVTKANESLRNVPLMTIADSTSVATTTVISDVLVASLPTSAQIPARKAYQRYEEFLEESNLLQDLHTEIRRLSLDRCPSGGESCLSLLQKSEDAFKIPSGPEGNGIGVLIPLRESINRAYADLLSRRPRQGKAGNPGDKVRSICSQACHPAVDSAQIERLAQQADDLNDYLSGAKQGGMTRTQIREAVNRGLVFFLAFLRMIDETRLR